jgi:coenzyme F420 hydrogenase subunit beta
VRRIGEVAERYGGEVHITVRQELSILGVPEEKLDPALQDLAEAGLLPGSAGMTFRNVVSCLGSDYCFKAAAETTSLDGGDRGAVYGGEDPGPLKVGSAGAPSPAPGPSSTR